MKPGFEAVLHALLSPSEADFQSKVDVMPTDPALHPQGIHTYIKTSTCMREAAPGPAQLMLQVTAEPRDNPVSDDDRKEEPHAHEHKL